jgi:hypothetical protein
VIVSRQIQEIVSAQLKKLDHQNARPLLGELAARRSLQIMHQPSQDLIRLPALDVQDDCSPLGVGANHADRMLIGVTPFALQNVAHDVLRYLVRFLMSKRRFRKVERLVFDLACIVAHRTSSLNRPAHSLRHTRKTLRLPMQVRRQHDPNETASSYFFQSAFQNGLDMPGQVNHALPMNLAPQVSRRALAFDLNLDVASCGKKITTAAEFHVLRYNIESLDHQVHHGFDFRFEWPKSAISVQAVAQHSLDSPLTPF